MDLTAQSSGTGTCHQRWSSEPSPSALNSKCGHDQSLPTAKISKKCAIKPEVKISTSTASAPSEMSGNGQFRAKPMAFHRQLFAQLQNAVKTATGKNRKQQKSCSTDVSSSQPTDGSLKVACSLDRAVLKNSKQKNDSMHDTLTTKSSLPCLIGSGSAANTKSKHSGGSRYCDTAGMPFFKIRPNVCYCY